MQVVTCSYNQRLRDRSGLWDWAKGPEFKGQGGTGSPRRRDCFMPFSRAPLKRAQEAQRSEKIETSGPTSVLPVSLVFLGHR